MRVQGHAWLHDESQLSGIGDDCAVPTGEDLTCTGHGGDGVGPADVERESLKGALDTADAIGGEDQLDGHHVEKGQKVGSGNIAARINGISLYAVSTRLRGNGRRPIGKGTRGGGRVPGSPIKLYLDGSDVSIVFCLAPN